MTIDLYPDDEAFLNALQWESGWMRRYCDRCEQQAATIPVGHVEAASGPGYELRYCRACAAPFLQRARAASKRPWSFRPTVPNLVIA
ncbi:hypothetical protein [Streptacidiphilus sp. EB129]|uniref:hypothetical protein n=1 Tax=Streptacidiphilus sp. EB129 TaxID=3156262 RepID=UPI0035124FDB